ncbi:hypothetical protein [Pontibacter populi]|uniref:DUF4488 domain-containing protein n=1 Tax=Pontibacter populi TaxID=890055 RepID=A0ABV1RVM0_9BACT
MIMDHVKPFLFVVNFSVFLLLLTGCNSSEKRKFTKDLQKDLQIEPKHIVGLWETRLVGERNGELVSGGNIYVAFTKPNRYGKGKLIYLLEENESLYAEENFYQITDTYNDGKFIEFDHLTDVTSFEETFEIIDKYGASAVWTEDNREVNKLITELSTEELGAADVPADDFPKTHYYRVLDQDLIDKAAIAIDQQNNE